LPGNAIPGNVLSENRLKYPFLPAFLRFRAGSIEPAAGDLISAIEMEVIARCAGNGRKYFVFGFCIRIDDRSQFKKQAKGKGGDVVRRELGPE
jgi:hypothetical protein